MLEKAIEALAYCLAKIIIFNNWVDVQLNPFDKEKVREQLSIVSELDNDEYLIAVKFWRDEGYTEILNNTDVLLQHLYENYSSEAFDLVFFTHNDVTHLTDKGTILCIDGRWKSEYLHLSKEGRIVKI